MIRRGGLRGGEWTAGLTEVDPDAALAQDEVLLDAHVALFADAGKRMSVVSKKGARQARLTARLGSIVICLSPVTVSVLDQPCTPCGQ